MVQTGIARTCIMLVNCLVSAFTIQPSRRIRNDLVDQIQGYLGDLRVILFRMLCSFVKSLSQFLAKMVRTTLKRGTVQVEEHCIKSFPNLVFDDLAYLILHAFLFFKSFLVQGRRQS